MAVKLSGSPRNTVPSRTDSRTTSFPGRALRLSWFPTARSPERMST